MGSVPSRSKILRDAITDLNLALSKLDYLRDDDPHYRLVRDKVAEARDWLDDYRSQTRRRRNASSKQSVVDRFAEGSRTGIQTNVA